MAHDLRKWISVVEDVWHGSRHHFDTFSTEFIGSGEGHGRYGWGLYFTDTREVADYYKRMLAQDFTYKGRAVDRESWLGSAIYALVYNNGDKEEAKAGWKPTSKHCELVDKIDYSKVRVKSYVYGAHIPDQSEFLLWDEPIEKQSPAVRHALESLVHVPPEVEAQARQQPGASPWQIWNEHLAQQGKTLNGEELYWALAAHVGDKQASVDLLSKGVHGIKYLDGVSRAAGSGSYNYVIFDGALATITQKPTGRSSPVL